MKTALGPMLKTILFTILVPGTVLILVPLLAPRHSPILPRNTVIDAFGSW